MPRSTTTASTFNPSQGQSAQPMVKNTSKIWRRAAAVSSTFLKNQGMESATTPDIASNDSQYVYFMAEVLQELK